MPSANFFANAPVLAQSSTTESSLRMVLAQLLRSLADSGEPHPDPRLLPAARTYEPVQFAGEQQPAALVPLSVADERLTAELLLDVQLGEARYLLLAVASPPTDEIILSPREREIVHLVAQGYPNKAIAQTLEISPWTVNTYLRRIFAKLGVTSRAEMVASSINAGLLQTIQPSA
jgi:DNA-binding CsgD family transcriptional regulator